MTRSPRAAALLGLLAAVLVAGCSAPAVAAPGPVDRPVITTRGTGTASAAADIVTVTLGVQTSGTTASEALAANNEAAAAVQEVLRGAGVAGEDLRTADLSIFPSYSDEGRTITGYEVSNRVTAVLRDLAGAGALVDAAAGAAGDAIRVDGLVFGLDDDGEARTQARADAVTQAIAQARELADAAGVGLSGIVSITEVPVAGLQPLPYAAEAAADGARAAVPLQPGTQDVEVVVEVVHALG
ncbi:MAG: hypothetical protein AVDCRST_MAG66-716 [uncultured Pseudonocardia sp.]|uniref:DUF541 domain-containing protein n=1 Tax=uncultured Pseudonocardia sp. TaxID=211455 RepID=A0A6J4NHU6_9PSEU|nr:MAG: hypothetical protein AVDCRST_MAG66-716 [uncultured Pseudonocardia sp.]